MNRSVTIVPREDKALPSIQVFFAELRRNFSPSPARQEGTLFLSRVLVVVISTDNNEYFSSYNTIKEINIPLLIGTFLFVLQISIELKESRIQNPSSTIKTLSEKPKSMATNPESKTVSDSLYRVIYFTMQHGKHLLYSAVFLASSSVLINNAIMSWKIFVVVFV